MALRTIVQDGDPILKKVCRPVTKFDDRLGTLLDDMKETLLAANGLGLAGPQVGMMRRLFNHYLAGKELVSRHVFADLQRF